MPFTQGPVVIFFAGVVIYGSYKDDDESCGLCQEHYCYELKEPGDEGPYEEFDIRELEAYDPDVRHEDILEAAVSGGEFKDAKREEHPHPRERARVQIVLAYMARTELEKTDGNPVPLSFDMMDKMLDPDSEKDQVLSLAFDYAKAAKKRRAEIKGLVQQLNNTLEALDNAK